MHNTGKLAFAAVMAVGTWAATVTAAEQEITFGIGYSQLSMPANKDNPLYGRGGARFDLRYTGPVSEDYEQLRLGGGFTASGYSRWYDEEAFLIIDGVVYIVSSNSFESISLFIPEFYVSWQEPLGDRGWYLEPGVAVGLMIGTYSSGQASGWWWSYDDWETSINASIRPNVRVGYSNSEGDGGWVAGFELSYLWGGRLDFGDAGDSDIQEFYLGVYGGGRL